MKGHDCVIGSRSVLRTMLSAGVLAVLLACAGTAAGATWTVNDGGGASSLIRGGGRLADNHAQKGLCTIIAPRPIDRRRA